jgi:hypothetical protein
MNHKEHKEHREDRKRNKKEPISSALTSGGFLVFVSFVFFVVHFFRTP